MSERMVFVLSPGRCGTGYLAQAFGTVPGVAAYHEPEPDFADASRQAQRDPQAATTFWRERKLPAVRADPAPVYIETSHQFVFFADALLDLGERADVIVLTRPHRDIALSFWRRGTIPGVSPLGRKYLCDPEAPGVMVPLDHWKTFDEYQLCYWHSLEVEAQSARLAKRFIDVGCKVPWVTMDYMLTRDGFGKLAEVLGLPEPDWVAYEAIADQRVNATPKKFMSIGPSGDLPTLEAEVRAQGEPAHPGDGRPSVHAFLINVGNIREDLSEWRLGWTLDRRFRVRVEGSRASPVAANRNLAAKKFLRGGSDFMFMIDDDTVPATGNPLDLVEKDLDVVVFPTPMWNPQAGDEWPIQMNVELLPGEDGRPVGYLAQPDRLTEVASAGTAAILIARRVLEHPEMRAPFHDEFDADGIRQKGEDITFVKRVREAGFRVWAAMDYRCSHYKMIDLLLADMIFRQMMERTKKGEAV